MENNQYEISKKLKNFCNRVLISLIFMIIILILVKVNVKFKNFIKEKLFNTSFNFSLVNKYYNKYFGKFNLINNDLEKNVFSEINYYDYDKYLNGMKIKTGGNVLSIDSGIVVFKGEKEFYNNTLIIQTSSGYDIWYGNLNEINANIYDYVNENDLLAYSDNLYLVINKDNKYYMYDEYINEKNKN